MVYVHCSECRWSQDCFWDENYNPFKALADDWEKKMITKSLHEKVGGWDHRWLEERGFPTWKKLFIQECDRTKRLIMDMHWSTYQEYEKSDQKCPVCGAYTVAD